MFSSAVGNSVVQFVFLLLTLVLGAGAEEALPKLLGVGFPVLLVAVQYVSTRLPRVAATLFAIAAGVMEDALSGLPPMTSASYFLVSAVLVRRAEASVLPVLLTYPVYQLWLAIWVGGIGAGICWRVLLAAPAGALTAGAVIPLLAIAERKAALGERA